MPSRHPTMGPTPLPSRPPTNPPTNPPTPSPTTPTATPTTTPASTDSPTAMPSSTDSPTPVPTKDCCQDATAECKACLLDISVSDYCASSPIDIGCDCCHLAACLACNQISVNDYCTTSPHIVGCADCTLAKSSCEQNAQCPSTEETSCEFVCGGLTSRQCRDAASCRRANLNKICLGNSEDGCSQMTSKGQCKAESLNGPKKCFWMGSFCSSDMNERPECGELSVGDCGGFPTYCKIYKNACVDISFEPPRCSRFNNKGQCRKQKCVWRKKEKTCTEQEG